MPDLSVRERALRALLELFHTQEAGQPVSWDAAAGPYEFTWNDVVRTPLSDREHHMDYALAIVELNETKDRGFGWMDGVLSLSLDFTAQADTDEEAPELLNTILLNIQRRIRSDPHLTNTNGGSMLVIDLYETENVVSMRDYADKRVTGSVGVAMRYRHAVNDPRVFYPGRP